MSIKHDFYSNKIYSWWFQMAPGERPSFFSIKDVANLALNMSDDDRIFAESIGIGLAVRRLGFRKVRLMVGGVQRYVYEPTTFLARATPAPKELDSIEELRKEALRCFPLRAAEAV